MLFFLAALTSYVLGLDTWVTVLFSSLGFLTLTFLFAFLAYLAVARYEDGAL